MQSRAQDASWVERLQVLVGGIEEGVWVVRGLFDQVVDVWMGLERDLRDLFWEGGDRGISDRKPAAGAPPRHPAP